MGVYQWVVTVEMPFLLQWLLLLQYCCCAGSGAQFGHRGSQLPKVPVFVQQSASRISTVNPIEYSSSRWQSWCCAACVVDRSTGDPDNHTPDTKHPAKHPAIEIVADASADAAAASVMDTALPAESAERPLEQLARTMMKKTDGATTAAMRHSCKFVCCAGICSNGQITLVELKAFLEPDSNFTPFVRWLIDS